MPRRTQVFTVPRGLPRVRRKVRMTQALVVSEYQCLPLRSRQFAQAAAQKTARAQVVEALVLAAAAPVVQPIERPFGVRIRRLVIRVDTRHVVALHDIECAMSNDGRHPADRGTSDRIETPRRMPDPRKGVVQNFLGQFAPAHDAQRHPEQQRCRRPLKPLESHSTCPPARRGLEQQAPHFCFVQHAYLSYDLSLRFGCAVAGSDRAIRQDKRPRRTRSRGARPRRLERLELGSRLAAAT